MGPRFCILLPPVWASNSNEVRFLATVMLSSFEMIRETSDTRSTNMEPSHHLRSWYLERNPAQAFTASEPDVSNASRHVFMSSGGRMYGLAVTLFPLPLHLPCYPYPLSGLPRSLSLFHCFLYTGDDEIPGYHILQDPKGTP